MSLVTEGETVDDAVGSVTAYAAFMEERATPVLDSIEFPWPAEPVTEADR